MALWFVLGLLAPAALIVAALFAAWLSSVKEDRRIRDEETARARSVGSKPGVA
jgi:hypothetical protein